MESIVLDSSVVIAFLNPEDRHHKAARRELEAAKGRFQISTITVTESIVLAARQSSAVADEFLADLEKFFGPFISALNAVAAV